MNTSAPENMTVGVVSPDNVDDTSTSTSSARLTPDQFVIQAREPSPLAKEVEVVIVKDEVAKHVVPASLLSLDGTKQVPSGITVVKTSLETVQRLGYDNCLVHKKKGPFLKSMNDILHA